MRVPLALWLVAVGLLPAAAGAESLATRNVQLTDTALRPVEVGIDVNDSVRWRNDGRKVHRVASDTRAWPAFRLRPGAARSVRFRRAGCYRYKVDGKLRGRVAVAASCGGGGGAPGLDEKVYRYDITVTGRARTIQRHSGDPPGPGNANGTVDVDLAWESTYRDVKLKKLAVGALTYVITNAGTDFARGTTKAEFAYKHDRPGLPSVCDGDFALNGLASRITASGTKASTPRASFDFRSASQLTLAVTKTLFNRIHSTQEAACKYSDEPEWIDTAIVRDGVTWQEVNPLSNLPVTVERRASRTFFPLDRLEGGDRFTVETGQVQDERQCNGGGPKARVCTERFTGFLRVKFVPRRS